MGLVEAVKKTADQHKEDIMKIGVMLTYAGDLVTGTPGVEHPYREAWLGTAQRAGRQITRAAIYAPETAIIAEVHSLELPTQTELAEAA